MKGNSVSIKGNLTRNAEIRGVSGDRSCVAFGLAWNNNRLRADNTPLEQPHYFEVSCWMSAGQQSYFLPLLTKGTACSIIDGYLSYGTWVTKDGEKRSRVEIAVTDPFSSLTLLAPRKHRPEQALSGHEAVGVTADAVRAPTSVDVDAAEDGATDSQAVPGVGVPAAESACAAEPPLEPEELLPENVFADVAREAVAESNSDNASEPSDPGKADKATKPEATSSKKRATA